MAQGATTRIWRRTLFVLILLIVGGFGLVTHSIFHLQIVQGEELQQRAVDQQTRDVSLSAQRGTIYDRNMTVLAMSSSVWDVVLEPAYIEEEQLDLIVDGLAGILGMEREDVMEHATKNNAYEILARKVENDVKEQILQFKQDNDIGSGIRLVENYKRDYPYGTSASTVLGFTGTDNTGLAGIEAQYDKELSGVAGRLVTAKNAVGTDMPLQYEQKVDAQNGHSLVLTIDRVVQHFLEKNLEEGIINNKVQNRATGIVMDVNTGEIIAMAVKGDYDPNNPLEIADPVERARIESLPEEEQGAVREAAQLAQWRNKAVSDTYYPGSVFKMCTGSMGLEENLINENTTFTCNGAVGVSGTTIHCWRRGGHGTETFAQGLCNSCNPFFIHIGQLLGPDKFFKYFESFGFTERTGIDLPGESRSIYYTAEQLNPVELATESFGQNFSITPIQMITACAAVANGGYLVQPHVVKQILDDQGNIVETIEPKIKRQVISTETSERMCAILQQNATTGTAKNGYLPGYRVAGKTGTSEKIQTYLETGTMEYIASYCGFAPADNPQYAMLLFFDEPKGDSYYGGSVAGPVWAKTMREILPYLGVEQKYTESELEKLDIQAPDVTGMTLSEAQSTIEGKELSYRVYGDGDTVISQIPAYGETIPQNGTMALYTDSASEDRTVTVPDLTGMTLSQANSTAVNAGLNISITGAALTGSNALSQSQSIEPGTSVSPGTVITVTFVEYDQVQ